MSEHRRWSDSPELRRHENDEYAHGKALAGLRREVSDLKNWRWFITGALALLGLEVTVFGGFLGAHLLGH